jgi:hypothetical protein
MYNATTYDDKNFVGVFMPLCNDIKFVVSQGLTRKVIYWSNEVDQNLSINKNILKSMVSSADYVILTVTK